MVGFAQNYAIQDLKEPIVYSYAFVGTLEM